MNHRRIKRTWKHRLARRINRQLREHLGNTVEVYYSPYAWNEGEPASRGHVMYADLSIPWKEQHVEGVGIDLRRPEPLLDQLANKLYEISAAYSELAEKVTAIRGTRTARPQKDNPAP